MGIDQIAFVDVARVVELYRYPVKSMAGQRITASEVNWHGLLGDRRYAFVREGDARGFPWLTGRNIPAMVTYVPTLADPTRPRESAVQVRLPDGRELPVTSPDLLADLSARYPRSPIHLVQLSRGAYDAENISLISTTTLHAIGDTIGEDLDPRRFRPNIVVELLPGAGATTEDDWLGMLLRFGDRPDSARARIRRKDARCMMINLDPTTGRQTPAVLRTVVHLRHEHAGIYGTVVTPGTVEVDDIISLVRDTGDA